VKLSPVTAVGVDREAVGGGFELLPVILRKKKGKSGGRVLQPRWIEKESVDGGVHRRGALDGDEAERSGVGWAGEMANSFSQLERLGNKTGLDGHTRPTLGRQCGREVAGSRAAIARARRQRPGGRWAVLDTDKWAFVHFEFPMVFNHSNFEVSNGDLSYVQNSRKFA
jgi:hypothetical protein